jgi:Mu-like prophage I protein
MSNVALEDFLKEQFPIGERHSGYIVDMTSVSLADAASGGATSWVHALSLGTFKHPFWGDMKFTPERIQRFALSVLNRVRGIDPSINYSHETDEAAGWVKSAEARSDGLWLLVEWTKAAAEKIRNKEFRYFSSEFADEWEDPATGTKHKDVILGGGLTNRPFIKNLVPVNLSELYDKEGKENEPMKELLKALGLAEDASDEDATAALNKLLADAKEEGKKLAEPPPPKTDEPALDDKTKEIIRLAEESPVVKELVDQVAELKAERRLSEVKSLVEGWGVNSRGKYALPEAITPKLSEAMVAMPIEQRQAFAEVMNHILEKGLVKLGEKGRTRTASDNDDPAETTAAAEIDARVKKLMEDDPKLDFGEAYSQVSQDTELFDRYRRESISGLADEEEVEA